MFSRRILIAAFLPLLFACAPRMPGLPGPEAPAGPLHQAIEERQQAFMGLTGLASVQAARKGRKRTFETVGIAIRPPEKIRMEAYGPLGALALLVWNGQFGEFRMQGSHRLLTPSGSGLEKLLGVDAGPGELGAALWGGLPQGAVGSGSSAAYCGPRAGCVLEIRQDSLIRRVSFAPTAASGSGMRIMGSELYRAGELVYRARFEELEDRLGFLVPMKIVIENPDRHVAVTIRYQEVDVNIPVSDELFRVDSGEDNAP